MTLRAALPAVLLLALLSPGPRAGAADFIAVADNYFDPQVWVAGSGDTVEWRTTCSYGGDCAGAHNVTAYAGASFASGNLGYPGTYSVALTSDDPVSYRCTNHSSLVNGTCNGMCGRISANADVTPPSATITRPGPDEVVLATTAGGSVTIAGTAADNVGVAAVRVRVFDVLGMPSDTDAACAGCPGPAATWTATRSLPPGVYTIEARAFDTAGSSRTSARVRFFVV